MSTKYFCDRCGDEITINKLIRVVIKESDANDQDLHTVGKRADVCQKCLIIIRHILDPIPQCVPAAGK